MSTTTSQAPAPSPETTTTTTSSKEIHSTTEPFIDRSTSYVRDTTSTKSDTIILTEGDNVDSGEFDIHIIAGIVTAAVVLVVIVGVTGGVCCCRMITGRSRR
jgi:hypothetical protein